MKIGIIVAKNIQSISSNYSCIEQTFLHNICPNIWIPKQILLATPTKQRMEKEALNLFPQYLNSQLLFFSWIIWQYQQMLSLNWYSLPPSLYFLMYPPTPIFFYIPFSFNLRLNLHLVTSVSFMQIFLQRAEPETLLINSCLTLITLSGYNLKLIWVLK